MEKRLLLGLFVVMAFPIGVACAGPVDGSVSDKRFESVRHINMKCDVSYLTTDFDTLDKWQARRADVRERILTNAGLVPTPERTPLNARIFGRIEEQDYSIEKVYFESYPGFYVTGNLYRPKREGPFPAVAYPHGHWDYGRLENSVLCSAPGRLIIHNTQVYSRACFYRHYHQLRGQDGVELHPAYDRQALSSG